MVDIEQPTVEAAVVLEDAFYHFVQSWREGITNDIEGFINNLKEQKFGYCVTQGMLDGVNGGTVGIAFNVKRKWIYFKPILICERGELDDKRRKALLGAMKDGLSLLDGFKYKASVEKDVLELNNKGDQKKD